MQSRVAPARVCVSVGAGLLGQEAGARRGWAACLLLPVHQPSLCLNFLLDGELLGERAWLYLTLKCLVQSTG